TIFGNALGAKTYFTHPHSPWEKGLIENTNGLIRQYFPKGTDFNLISEEELKFVQNALNNRPRKILGWRMPKEVFTQHLKCCT
ncbi:MAG: IS30 family transposase, partial [Neisseriaceae bacterium]|nr:IS30 family transposase [Neisseriaceae bacterium]